MSRPDELDAVVADIVVDCYGDDEQDTAFLTVFEEVCDLPAPATLLGWTLTVVRLDQDGRGLVATCSGPEGSGEVGLVDLAFPPETLAAWVHAAYRHHLGLPPFPAHPRPGWTLSG